MIRALDAARPACSSPAFRRPANGFTLVELLVAFAIIGFAMAVVPIAYSKLNQSIEYRAAIRAFVTNVTAARASAMVTGQASAIEVNLENKTFGFGNRFNHKWPKSYEIKAEVASQAIQANKIARIKFYPDGSSTGGSITVLRAPGVGVRFRIDWLTGRLTQEVVHAD